MEEDILSKTGIFAGYSWHLPWNIVRLGGGAAFPWITAVQASFAQSDHRTNGILLGAVSAGILTSLNLAGAAYHAFGPEALWLTEASLFTLCLPFVVLHVACGRRGRVAAEELDRTTSICRREG